jgi:acetyl esterase/lipase
MWTRKATQQNNWQQLADKFQHMKKNYQLRLQWILLLTTVSGLLNGCAPRLPHTVKVQRDIEYARVNGHSLRLDIYSPKKSAGKLPVVVWLHGGGWNMGDKNFCPIGFMAEKNLAIVSVDYRLDTIAIFPAQLDDCKGAIRWLRANADKLNLDADHIGIFGVSAGGHLGLLLATTAGNSKMEGDVGGNLNFSSTVQCVCAFYPPTELNRLVPDPKWRARPDGLAAKLIGGAIGENVDKAIAASPLTYVDKNCAPVFLMHGGADELVPPEQSQIFYDALLKVGVEAQLEIIPGKGHGIIAPPPVAEKIYSFYNRHLNHPPGRAGVGD